MGQLGFPGNHRDGTGFQDIADCLLLGEDQPSLWGSGINGNDQDNQVLWPDQISDNALFVLFGRNSCGKLSNQFFQLLNLIAVFGADADLVFLLCISRMCRWHVR